MNDSTQEVHSASQEMSAGNQAILQEVALLQNATVEMKTNMEEMAVGAASDDGEGAEVHQRGTVALDGDDGKVRAGEVDAEGDLGGVPHRADGEEVAVVRLAGVFAQLEDLARDHSGGVDDERTGRERGEKGAEGVLARQVREVGADGRLRTRGEGPLADDEGDGARLAEGESDRAFKCCGCAGRLGGEDFVRDAERVEQGDGALPLGGVLGLVGNAGLAAPADEEDHRDAVDGGVGEGEERVDGVALAGVLEVDETGTARREEVSGGEGDGAAFVRRDHVAESARRIGGARGEFGAEGLQQRIRDAGEEVDAETAAVFEKRGRIDHGVKRG